MAGSDANLTFGYNSASQIVSQTRDNDLYAYSPANASKAYTANGLNQYSSVAGTTQSYDVNGNLTSDGSNSYVYDAENRLTSVSGAHNATLSYDPLGRLWQLTSGGATTRFVYDGDQLVAEFDGSGNLLRSYVHAPGEDVPVEWLEGSGTSNRRFLSADERGSIVAVMDASGNRLALNSYDEYGNPGSSNQGKFQYTGQIWLPEVGLYYYKARMYHPGLGRFLQTDPAGPIDSLNLYQYALSDPVNYVDTLGLYACADRGFTTIKGGWTDTSGPGPIIHAPQCGSSISDLIHDSLQQQPSLYDIVMGGEVVDARQSSTKQCVGSAEFTAVGGNQAKAAGALAAYGIHPVSGTVAVNPRQFGVPYGGSAAVNEAGQRSLAALAGQLTIASPAAAQLSAQYGGPAGPSFTIGDVGDTNVRSGNILRLDLYRFPTEGQANKFGRRVLPVGINNYPSRKPCPPGTK